MVSMEFLGMGVLLTIVFGVIFVFYSFFYREIIIINVFNGMDKDTIKQYINKQQLKQRVFMTYIVKCNPTGKQRLGIAMWFLLGHYIHAVISIVNIIKIWYEVYLNLFLNQEFQISVYIYGYYFTHGTLNTILERTSLLAFPISFLIAIPFSLLSKNKIIKNTTDSQNDND